MEHAEMKRIPFSAMFDFMVLQGGVFDAIKTDIIDPIKSSCCGIDGPSVTQEAVDVDVYTPDGEKTKLLSMAKAGRPLVLFFAGCVT